MCTIKGIRYGTLCTLLILCCPTCMRVCMHVYVIAIKEDQAPYDHVELEAS